MNNNLEELINNISLLETNINFNEKIISFINIFINSKLYIDNKDDNLKIYLSSITNIINNFLIKMITYEIENNMIYKENDKDIPNNSMFPICKLLVRKIIDNNEEISKDKIYLKEIIQNALLFSIHYLNDYYNFDVEI